MQKYLAQSRIYGGVCKVNKILGNSGFTKGNICGNKSEFMDSFLLLRCFLSLSVSPSQSLYSLFLFSSCPPCPFAIRILLLVLPIPFSLSFLFSVALRPAKVQRRGLPVVDDQRGFPFSTPCCCAATTTAPPPSSSLPSSSLFFRALGSTGMIILYEKIQRELHERL